MNKKLLEKFFIHLQFSQGLNLSSQKNYFSDLILFCNFTKDKNLVSITPKIISSYIKFLSRKDFSEKTIIRKLVSIRLFFDFLIMENYITKNPCALQKTPKLKIIFPQILSLQEINKLTNYQKKSRLVLNIRDSAMIELLYSCGLRVSELTQLTFQNISLPNKTIKVSGKRYKERIIPFGKVAHKKLLHYIETSRPQLNKKLSSIFFLSKNGFPLTRQRVWTIIKKKTLACKIDKNISPHTLRHSFATHLLDNDTPLHYIQKLLGHSNIDTTEIYTHLSSNKLQKVHQRFHPRK